ncbi:MAG: MFS transporter [Thermofilaceae archaeon]
MSKSDSSGGMRNVYSLGFVSLFTDISTEMVMGYLPIFAVQELGASRAFLGLIEGVGELANYLLRIVSGFFSDRLGRRKPLVLAGYALSAVSKPMFAFARTPTDALVVRASDRAGKGLRTAPRDALISQSVKESAMGRAFGLHRTLDQTGAIVGPLLATLLLPLVGPRNLFLLSFIPAAVALLILLLFVTDVRTQPREGNLLRGARSLLRGDFPLLLLAFGLFGLGFYDFSFVLVRSSELGVAGELVPLVYLGLNLFHSMVGYPIGILSDRVGREPLLALSLLLFSASSIAMAYASGLPAVLLLVLLYGLFFGMHETLYRAVIPHFAPSELRGTAYGLFYLVYGPATLLGMTLVGYLWDEYGRALAFTYSAVIGLVSAALLSVLVLRARRSRGP